MIKNAVMNYGAVQTSIYSHEDYYSADKSYYYDGDSKNTNHAVTIVGWDDTYRNDYFKNKPAYDGAFIVKNSWGKDWGEDGYFYISYCDKNIGKTNAVYIAEDTNKFDHIYQYDPLGMSGFAGYGTIDTAWFANVFEAGQKDENLSGVGFFVPAEDYQYEVFVSTDEDLSTRKKVASGKIDFGGYHTIEFPPEQIKANTKFAVIVRGSGTNHPIPLERPIHNATTAKAENGQSFISNNGEQWNDTNKAYVNTNVTLKAFTTDIAYEPTELRVQINDVVKFNMEFRGSGKYDIIIKDLDGKIIKEKLDQKGTEGLNFNIWDGTNNQGNIVKEGKYEVEIIPYKGQEPGQSLPR